MGNYKTFGNQEENVYCYDEMKSMFEKRDLDNLMEDQKREYLRNINLRHQERLNVIEKTKKKAFAIALSVSIAVGAAGIGYVDHVMKDKVPTLDNDMTSVEESYSYDDFIDYCNYVTETTGATFIPSQENYRQVVLSGELKQFVQEKDNGGKKL